MEGDRHGEEASSGDDDADAGTRPHPYYGCTFCKRGFSNAQALGGHMNIHRKDRAKAVAPPPPAVPSSPERGVDQGYYYACYGGGQSAYSPLSSSARRLLGEDLRNEFLQGRPENTSPASTSRSHSRLVHVLTDRSCWNPVSNPSSAAAAAVVASDVFEIMLLFILQLPRETCTPTVCGVLEAAFLIKREYSLIVPF
ncbi:hypothetical protein ZIOFF_060696 [Zingiber officinale]|uniref:C2H2-type domain-containing protein n=1 Tax=Zingiber officinale TaxID=94328 RepID=A0A8J5FBT2_ZINOF|nr:hypothetical protein ZIOFF_060696 [Zingiber officinale]